MAESDMPDEVNIDELLELDSQKEDAESRDSWSTTQKSHRGHHPGAAGQAAKPA